MHWLLPGVAAAASAAFAAAVLRQYAARRRPHQLAWGIALSMFAVASLALTAGVVAGWTPVSFKLYYLFGAILNVPWLALGTVELLAGPFARRAYAAGLAVFTVLSVVLVALARVTPADLSGRLLPEGKEFLPVAVRALAVVGNTVGTLIVVGGAVASGLAMRSRRDLRPRFEGNAPDRAGRAAGRRRGRVRLPGLQRQAGPRPGPGGERDVPGLPPGLGPGPPAGPLRPMTRVTLYTRAGCHLCEEAERVLRQEQPAAGFRLELVDIDRDPELARRYGVRVPVVAVDGEDLFEYEVPLDLLRARLGRVGAD